MLTRRKNRSMIGINGKGKSNGTMQNVDMERACHTYQILIHYDFRKGEM